MLVLIIFLIIILSIWMALFNLELKFRFENCEVIYNEKIKNKLDIRCLKLYVDLIIFKRIKILTIKVNQEYCEIYKMKFNINGIKLSKDKDESSVFFVLKNLEEIKPRIDKFELNLSLGTREMFLTICLVPVLSTYISVLVFKYSTMDDKNTYIKITPNYFNINNYSLKFVSNIYVKAIDLALFILKRIRK